MNQFWKASQEKLNGKKIISVTCRQCNSGHILIAAQSRINFIILAYNNSIKSNFSDILRGKNNCKNSDFCGHPVEVNHISLTTPLCFWKIPTILWTNLPSRSNMRWEKLNGCSTRQHNSFSCIVPYDPGFVDAQPIYPSGPSSKTEVVSIFETLYRSCHCGNLELYVWVFHFYIVSGRSL